MNRMILSLIALAACGNDYQLTPEPETIVVTNTVTNTVIEEDDRSPYINVDFMYHGETGVGDGDSNVPFQKWAVTVSEDATLYAFHLQTFVAPRIGNGYFGYYWRGEHDGVAFKDYFENCRLIGSRDGITAPVAGPVIPDEYGILQFETSLALPSSSVTYLEVQCDHTGERPEADYAGEYSGFAVDLPPNSDQIYAETEDGMVLSRNRGQSDEFTQPMLECLVLELYEEVDPCPSAIVLHPDADGDGYGSRAGSVNCDGSVPIGWVLNDDDCDDTNPNVFPGNGC